VTAPSGPDSCSYEQDIDRTSGRLIATAVGFGSPEVRALADWLIANEDILEAILDSTLSNPDRLAAVRNTGLLDGAPHPAIDNIAEMIAEALGTPFASVSLVLDDRQIVVGCNKDESAYPRLRPLDMSVSKFVVVSGEPLIVDDASRHPLLARQRVVRDGLLRAFAGIPLADGSGTVLGTVSVWDKDPHDWSASQIQLLHDLTDVTCASIFGDSAFLPSVNSGAPVRRSSGKLRSLMGRLRPGS
jgi:hypothetical protein